MPWLQFRTECYLGLRPALLVFGVVMLASLACMLDGVSTEKSSRNIIRQILPTLTPTTNPDPNSAAIAALTPEPPSLALQETTSPAMAPAENPDSARQPLPASGEANPQLVPIETNDAPSPTITPPPLTTSPPTETPATAPMPMPAAETSGWLFSGVQLYPGPEGEGLLLYGDALNNTGSLQELSQVSTTLYDAQGQILTNADNVFGYWPIDIVPAGERLPFQLIIPDIQSAADFELRIEAQPKQGAPHHDFEFVNVDQWSEEGLTCLTGQLQNLGAPLQNYLVMMAVFYDTQNQVISFGEYYAPTVEEVWGDQRIGFEVCIESPSQEIARYELRGWGE
jgi:hypothetical protein